MILKLFQNGYFLDGSPHLFVSTASLTYFDFQLLMGTIDWLFQWPIECMYLLYIITCIVVTLVRN